jgi:tRNA G18 (ribose-2'-O)-methylase SpoU
MIIHSVTTIEDRSLQPYRTLRRPVDHQRDGIFVAEGEKVVRRLLESTLEILSLLLTPEWLENLRPVLASRPEELQAFVAPKSVVESIVGFHLHQGLMAVARIPQPHSLAKVLRGCDFPRLLVAVDGLTNAENLGVLVRNCAAFGVDAFLVGETSSNPYLRRAVRNSMGTVFRLPVVQLSDIVASIQELKTVHGIRVIAAHPHTDQRALHEGSFGTDCCIVFGSEGEGISENVLAACDELVAIPMKDGVDSLNVASASAVFLYEVQRQRSSLGLGSGGR